MLVPLAFAFPQAFGQQPPPKRLARDPQPLLGELLSGQCGTEVRIVPPIGLNDLLSQVPVLAVVRRASTQPVDQTAIPFGLEASLNPTNLSRTPLQQAGRFGLAGLSAHHRRDHLQPIPFPLTHRYPVSIHPLAFHLGKRTFLLC